MSASLFSVLRSIKSQWVKWFCDKQILGKYHFQWDPEGHSRLANEYTGQSNICLFSGKIYI